MAGGRPLKFQSEREFCAYLEANMDNFCKDVLDDELFSYRKESYLIHKSFGRNIPRIDFDIKTKKGIRVLVECKNPSQTFAEMSRAISQLLTYATIAGEDCKLVLATSATIPIIQETIMKYELPITVALINKDVIAIWNKDFQQALNSGEIQVRHQYAIS